MHDITRNAKSERIFNLKIERRRRNREPLAHTQYVLRLFIPVLLFLLP